MHLQGKYKQITQQQQKQCNTDAYSTWAILFLSFDFCRLCVVICFFIPTSTIPLGYRGGWAILKLMKNQQILVF